MTSFGLYIHVPFCVGKCPYCDFVSFPFASLPAGTSERIVAALEREMDLVLKARPALAERPLASIYFGGGTPSLLDPLVVQRLVARARAAFRQAGAHADGRPRPEVTIECNPASAEMERLAAFARAGVNRVSLGVQSLDDATLRALGRRHSAAEARAACARVRALGLASWGLDLIYGAPVADDAARFGRDLDEALAFQPPHVSVYGLTLHEGTPLWERHERGEVQLPDEETQRAEFLLARRRLTAAGLHHYEISNYARPGHESRHNSLYWTGGEYVGLGVAAHSFYDDVRRANPSDLEEYLRRVEAGCPPAQAEEPPSPRARAAERIMLALRQCKGVSVGVLSREIGQDFEKTYAAEIAQLEAADLLVREAGQVRLTQEGLLLSDRVFEEFY